MDRMTTEFYVIDNKIFNSSNINFQFNNSIYQTYEVMRFTRGVLVFMYDHLNRMKEGIEGLKRGTKFSQKSAISNLLFLVQRIGDFEGNIKLLGRVDNKYVRFATYGIPHDYPDEELYKEGIRINTISVERPNPSVKQVYVADSISKRIELFNKDIFYESLLVDHNGYITEGSKSNFFLIKENHLFSAPTSQILNGITRKYVLKIAEAKGIPVIEKVITNNELDQYEAAFICGTSPKILPVRWINDNQYNPGHPMVKIVIRSYSELLEEHITEQRRRINRI